MTIKRRLKAIKPPCLTYFSESTSSPFIDADLFFRSLTKATIASARKKRGKPIFPVVKNSTKENPSPTKKITFAERGLCKKSFINKTIILFKNFLI